MFTKKLGFSDSKGGGIWGIGQQGSHVFHKGSIGKMASIPFVLGSGIRVRFNINEAEEDRRTERGIEARRERKENKKMAEQNREGRVRVTLAIIRSNARSASLVRLCRSEHRVEVLLNLLLDLFVDQHQTMRQRLAAFRAVPQNQFTNLTPQMENSLMVLHGEPSFAHTFSAYLPSAVITSEDSNEDSPTPRAKRARRRQRQEMRQYAGNRRRAAPEF